MPIPTNNSRPAIPYNPEQVLPNHNRYEALGKFPPTAKQLDGDFNGMVDLINTLAGAINDAAAGIFPGADNPLNADKFPTTDGQGNISWTHIISFNLADNVIQVRHIQDAAITPDKIQPQAVGTNQLAEGAVTTGKISDNAVTETKLSDNAVTTAKIADNAVTTTKVTDSAITPAKIGSANAASGDVLTADGEGSVSFLANTGRILQIVSYEDDNSLRNQLDHTATAQSPKSFKTAPFRVRITPQKTNSRIVIFYSINVGAEGNQSAAITLCKNNVPFKVGKNDLENSYVGVTHNIFSAMGQLFSDGQCGCYNFSSLFIDTGIEGTPITYEIKKAHPSTSINSGFVTSNTGGGRNTISVMHAIEIDL